MRELSKEMEERFARLDSEYSEYAELVHLMLQGKITDESLIVKTMDAIIERSDHFRFWELSKHLSRCILGSHPKLVDKYWGWMMTIAGRNTKEENEL